MSTTREKFEILKYERRNLSTLFPLILEGKRSIILHDLVKILEGEMLEIYLLI